MTNIRQEIANSTRATSKSDLLPLGSIVILKDGEKKVNDFQQRTNGPKHHARF